MLHYYLSMRNGIEEWVRDEEGQDFIEYALILVLIVLVAAAGLTGIGARIAAIFVQILGLLNGAAGGGGTGN